MSILPGNKTVKKITFGNSQVSKIYLGTNLVYEKAVPMPVKGDIIKFDAKGTGSTEDFLVISISGTTALVLARSSASRSYCAYNSTVRTVRFSDGNNHTQYDGSTLDNYFENTYYQSLSAKVKSAILTTSISQNCWCVGTAPNTSDKWRKQIPSPDLTTPGSSSGNTTTLKNNGYVSIYSTKHCFALSINELVTYFNNASTITTTQLSSLGVYTFWLRDAEQRLYDNSTQSTNGAIYCTSGYTISCIDAYLPSSIYAVPAFRINLSKIDFTIR